MWYLARVGEPRDRVGLLADDFVPLIELNLAWGDVFQLDVTPAITAEDGLKVGPDASALPPITEVGAPCAA